MKNKARVTLVLEYDINMKNYPPASTVEEAIKIDQANLDSGEWMLEDVISGCEFVSGKIEKVN